MIRDSGRKECLVSSRTVVSPLPQVMCSQRIRYAWSTDFSLQVELKVIVKFDAILNIWPFFQKNLFLGISQYAEYEDAG